MILGAFKPPFMDQMLGDTTIYNVHRFVAAFFIWAYFLTLLSEWPFMLIGTVYCIKEHRLKKSISGCFIIQTISCSIVACMYYSLTYLPPREMLDPGILANQNRPGWVYFLDKDAIHRIRLNGTQREFVVAAPNIDHFVFEPSPDGMFLDLRVICNNKEDLILLPKLIPKSCCLKNDGYIFLHILDFRPPGTDKVKLFPQNGAGAIIKNTETGTQLVFMMHGLWFMYYRFMGLSGFALSGDLFGFEMGKDIVLLDYPARKAAVLTHGQFPIFVPEERCNGT